MPGALEIERGTGRLCLESHLLLVQLLLTLPLPLRRHLLLLLLAPSCQPLPALAFALGVAAGCDECCEAFARDAVALPGRLARLGCVVRRPLRALDFVVRESVEPPERK